MRRKPEKEEEVVVVEEGMESFEPADPVERSPTPVALSSGGGSRKRIQLFSANLANGSAKGNRWSIVSLEQRLNEPNQVTYEAIGQRGQVTEIQYKPRDTQHDHYRASRRRHSSPGGYRQSDQSSDDPDTHPLSTHGLRISSGSLDGVVRSSQSPSGTGQNPSSPGGYRRTSQSPDGHGQNSLTPGGYRRTSKSPDGIRQNSQSPGGYGRSSTSPDSYRRNSQTPEDGYRYPMSTDGLDRSSPSTEDQRHSKWTRHSRSKTARARGPSTASSRPGPYERHRKPPFSYIALIVMAIRQAPNHRLTLSEINDFLMRKFEFFRGTYTGWRNSIRHNLSLNECFVKVLRDPNRPWGKDNYWTLNPNSNYTLADGAFRRRRRRVGRRSTAASTNAHLQPATESHLRQLPPSAVDFAPTTTNILHVPFGTHTPPLPAILHALQLTPTSEGPGSSRTLPRGESIRIEVIRATTETRDDRPTLSNLRRPLPGPRPTAPHCLRPSPSSQRRPTTTVRRTMPPSNLNPSPSDLRSTTPSGLRPSNHGRRPADMAKNTTDNGCDRRRFSSSFTIENLLGADGQTKPPVSPTIGSPSAQRLSPASSSMKQSYPPPSAFHPSRQFFFHANPALLNFPSWALFPSALASTSSSPLQASTWSRLVAGNREHFMEDPNVHSVCIFRAKNYSNLTICPRH